MSLLDVSMIGDKYLSTLYILLHPLQFVAFSAKAQLNWEKRSDLIVFCLRFWSTYINGQPLKYENVVMFVAGKTMYTFIYVWF